MPSSRCLSRMLWSSPGHNTASNLSDLLLGTPVYLALVIITASDKMGNSRAIFHLLSCRCCCPVDRDWRFLLVGRRSGYRLVAFKKYILWNAAIWGLGEAYKQGESEEGRLSFYWGVGQRLLTRKCFTWQEGFTQHRFRLPLNQATFPGCRRTWVSRTLP